MFFYTFLNRKVIWNSWQPVFISWGWDHSIFGKCKIYIKGWPVWCFLILIRIFHWKASSLKYRKKSRNIRERIADNRGERIRIRIPDGSVGISGFWTAAWEKTAEFIRKNGDVYLSLCHTFFRGHSGHLFSAIWAKSKFYVICGSGPIFLPYLSIPTAPGFNRGWSEATEFSLTRKERALPDSYSGQELRPPVRLLIRLTRLLR